MVANDAGGAPINANTASKQLVEVYGVEKKENEQSGYIISEEGKRFMVKVYDDRVNPTVSLSWRLSIDGERVSNNLFRVEEAKRKRSNLFKWVRLTSTTRTPFLFSSIKISDGHDECNATPEFIKNVGTIVVKVFRMGPSTPKPKMHKHVVPEPSKVVHESTKKGMISHAIGFGAVEECEPSPHYCSERLDPKDKPFASFKFYYRSKDLLDLQSIIPAQQVDAVEEIPDEKPAVAGPGPRSQKRQVITISSYEEEDLAAELARLRRENAEYKKVKQEQEVISRVKAEKGAGIKKEVKPAKGKRTTVLDVDSA